LHLYLYFILLYTRCWCGGVPAARRPCPGLPWQPTRSAPTSSLSHATGNLWASYGIRTIPLPDNSSRVILATLSIPIHLFATLDNYPTTRWHIIVCLYRLINCSKMINCPKFLFFKHLKYQHTVIVERLCLSHLVYKTL